MLPHLPWYLPLTIILVNSIFWTYWVVNMSIALRRLGKPNVVQKVSIFGGVLIAWVVLQAYLAFSGFYGDFASLPPRFLFAITPPLTAIVLALSIPSSRRVLSAIPLSSLTYIHTQRIAVELVVWGLFLYGATPRLMSFAGYNFDILVGATAPLVGYLCFTKKILSEKIALIWHIIGLGFLVVVATLFVFSVPSLIQLFEVEQANVAFFYFPFIWAPTHGVPTVIISHCIAILQLSKKNS